MKQIQWVLERLPDGWPKIGVSEVSFNISDTLMSVSFHLNIKNPPGINTRKHSAKPFRKTFFQSALPRAPYFIIW